MASSTQKDWTLTFGLMVLCFVPAVAGIFRLVQLTNDANISLENARFFASPFPVVIHIFSSLIYSILGALQFNASFRRNNTKWHRASGKLLIPCGLASAMTGLWMAQFYPSVNFDGAALYVIRLLVGFAMILCLCFGFVAIKKRDILLHRAWMMRGYALGLGAATQVLTHIPWFIFPDIQGELARTVFMGAGWAINLAIAEWLIVKQKKYIKVN